MTREALWDQGTSGPALSRTKLLPVVTTESFLIVLYITNYSSECHPRPNGQKASGPKDPSQQGLVLKEGR